MSRNPVPTPEPFPRWTAERAADARARILGIAEYIRHVDKRYPPWHPRLSDKIARGDNLSEVRNFIQERMDETRRIPNAWGRQEYGRDGRPSQRLQQLWSSLLRFVEGADDA